MRIFDIISRLNEGGWTDTATQQTTLNPTVVAAALNAVTVFVKDFNQWLTAQGNETVAVGAPVGSTAYYKVDTPDTVYGDIDLQMIAPSIEGKSLTQVTTLYNNLADTFISETSPAYVYQTGKPARGHIIFKIADDYVQVDFMWTVADLADWARWRSTPQRGIKGVIYGKIYKTLGDLLTISIQSSGAQMKIKDGLPANFVRSRKVDRLDTISTDIGSFGTDILKYVYEQAGGTGAPKVHPQLKATPGLSREEVKIADLISVVIGLGKSFEMNGLYGKFNLEGISNYQEYIEKFSSSYTAEIEEAMVDKKYDKAESPEAKATVLKIQQRLRDGLELVLSLLKNK